MKKQGLMYKCNPITGKHNDSFVGIKAKADGIEIFYPETISLSKDEIKKRNEILAIIRSISLAKTKYGETNEIFEAKNIGDSFVVDAYIWILKDYLVYGKYINSEKDYVTNVKGKINWKRTLNKVPIISGGNIIYKNCVMEIKHQQDNLLTEIYKYCVRVASAAIGWLIGVNADEQETVPFNKKLFETCLFRELEQTFNDEKRKRITIMKMIVSELSSENDFLEGFTYGVNDYSYIYERMIDRMFGNVSHIQDFYPNGEWDLKCFDEKFSSSNLRPDTVISTSKGIYILDAKFYRFGHTKDKKDLPNTSSIQKQITYGEFISNVIGKKYVVNAFIMPYSKDNNCLDLYNNMEYIGASTAKWKKQDKVYEYVFVVLLDTKFLLLNWKRQDDSYRNELTQLLDNQCNELLL